MKELIEKMKVLLSSHFALYLKAHNFHWNVTGSDFAQLHEFFKTVYTELWAATDLIAEHIRQLNSYAPGSLERFQELSVIPGERNVKSASEMVSKLKSDNAKLSELLAEIYPLAEEAKEFGLSNFIQDRMAVHSKLSWMLTAILTK